MQDLSEFCLYNAIKTPDGTVLWCKNAYDYQIHTDALSGEVYINDGLADSIRRSVNDVPYEDLSVFLSDPFEKIRKAPFWGSYGIDGKSPERKMCLEEMEKSHIQTILKTQKKIKGTEIEGLFIKELEYRTQTLKDHMESVVVTQDEHLERKRPKI